MADSNIKIDITANVAQAQASISRLEAQIRILQENQGAYERRFGEFAGTRFVENQTNALRAQIGTLQQISSLANAKDVESGSETSLQRSIAATIGLNNAFKSASESASSIGAEVEKLSSNLLNLSSVAASGYFGGFTTGVLDQIAEARTKIRGLVAGGASGGPITQQVVAAHELETEVGLQQALAQAAVQYESRLKAISAAIDANNARELQRVHNARVAQQIITNQVHPASGAVVDIINQTTGVGRAAAFTKEQIEEMSRAWPKAAAGAKQFATATADGAGLAVLGVRELSVGFDELSRHQTGAFISTLGAFARRIGVLNVVINALSGPWGAFAAAGVAALAAVGYEAEQTYQRFASIRDTESELAIRGFGSGTGGVGPAALGASAQEFDTLQKQTSEYTGTVREMQAELNKLPSSAQGLRLSLGTMAESLSGFRHSSPVDELKRIVKEFDNGPDAALKYLNALLGLDGQMSRSGQTFGELIKNAQTTADKFQILGEIVNRFNEGSIGRAGAASRDAKENLPSFSLAAAAAAVAGNELAGIDYSSSMDRLVDAVKKVTEPVKDLNTESTRLSETFIEQAAAIERGNAQLDKRREVLRDLANAEAGVARLQKENADLVGQRPKEGTSGRAPGIDTRPAERAAANLGARAERTPLDEAGERQHRINLDNIHNEAEARRADLQAQLQAAQARAAEERRYETEKLTLGATPENRMSADEVSRRVEASEAVKKADEGVAEAQRRLSDESTQHQISNLRAIVAEEARGSQERINAQRQIIAIDQIQVALGREKPEKVDQDRVQLGNLVRQAQTRAFQEERDNARAAIIDAKDHANAVEEVAKAYDHLRAVSGQPGVPSATGAQINREEIRDLKSIQEQSFSRLEEFNHSAERLDNARLAAAKASLSAQVSAHQMSKEDEARAEANLTSSYLSEQEKRIQSELEINGITEKEKQRLYQELAQLYTKDAEAQEKAQQKITAAIEEENQKRIQSFTTMFDSIGSGLEKVLTAELTGNLAERGSALRSFGQTLVSSTIKAITSQVSDYAGRQIGPALGLTKEESKGGLGEVLGTALAKNLGLLKDVPKDNQQKSVELLQKAAEAQGNANKLLGDVVKNTADTAKLIQELLNKIKADGSIAAQKGIAQTTRKYSPAVAPEGEPIIDERTSSASGRMFSSLQTMGYSPTAAAAVVGNSIQESSLRPDAIGKAGELGLFQENAERRKALEEYAKSVNKPATDFQTQIEFMDKELSKLDPTFKTSGDSASALAARFEKVFERPKSLADASTRGRYAENVLTEQTGVRQTATSVPTDTNFGITIGDSIAAGMIRHGAPGEEVKMGTLGGTAAVGRTPEQVLADIQSIDPKKIAGQNVLLSTGLSNAPSQFDAVQQQIDALKADQAKSITLLGVGTKPTFAGLNDKLAELAKNQDNVAFGGPLSQVGKDQVHPEMRGGVSGYAVNLEQAQQSLSSSLNQLNSTSRASQSIGQQNNQVASQLVQGQQRSVDGLDKNTQADQKLTTSTDSAAQAYKQKPAGASANDNSSSTSSASSGLSLLTQGLGIAGSAAAIFGGQLSTTARVALGVVGVLSQLSSFTKNVTSTLGLFESSTKTATTATTLMQGASTVNATAFATDTAAVQTNAAAQTTSAASSTGGSFLKAIPLIGGLFDRGGIVPSAAGGMIVPEGALAGGGQVSILHPREMVLPANISETVQNAARGRTSLPGMPSLSMPAPVTHNAANSNMTYAPQITGRFGSMSRTELNSVLRSHGDAFEGMARNLLRNNGLFRSAG